MVHYHCHKSIISLLSLGISYFVHYERITMNTYIIVCEHLTIILLEGI